MLSRLSNFAGPFSVFKTNTEIPIDLILSLDSGTSSSYNPNSGSIEFFQSQYLECVSDDFKFGTNNFTVELWFNYVSNGEVQGLVTNYYTLLDVGVRLYIDNSGSLTGLIYEDPHFGYVIHPTTVTENTWHHAAVVRQGTTFSVYLDGVQSSVTSGIANINISENATIQIGKSFTNLDSQKLLGKITNLRISNSVVYTENFTPTEQQFQSNGTTSLLLLAIDESSLFDDSNTDVTAKVVTAYNSPSFSADSPTLEQFIYSGLWKDLTENNYDFTFDDNPIIIEQFGRSIYLTNNFAESSDFGTLKKFTLDTWVNIKSSVNWASFFTNIYSAPSDINMFVGHNSSGDIWSGFYKTDGDLFITSDPFTPTLYNWYNLTTSVDSENITFFVNGETHSITPLNGIQPSSSNLGYLIGKKWADDTFPIPYADSNISIIKVWNGALTYSTIHQNYTELLDRFTFVLDVEASSNWDASASTISDLRSGLLGTVSGIGYSNGSGGVLTFEDGSYINFGNPESLNQNGDISFLTWIKFTQFTTSFNTIAKHYGGGQNDFIFSVKDFLGLGTGPRKMNIYTQNNSGVPGDPFGGLFDDTEIELNTWYLLGFTLENGGNLTYYINGLTSSTFTGMSRSRVNNNFIIGSIDLNDGITGEVGEFKFYNRILSEQEVLDFYNLTEDKYKPGFGSLVFSGNEDVSKIYSISDDYIIGTSDFTIESWFKQFTPNKSGVISMRDSTDDGININIREKVSSLYSFNISDGSTSRSSLLYFQGKLFGTTYAGGENSNGLIFSTVPDGTTYSILHNFTGVGGENSWSNLIESSGILYGTTYLGGTSNYGVIYQLNPDGSSYSVIHEFDSVNGRNPASSLIEFGEFLYGTTRLGGSSNAGVIYKINKSSGSYSVIHTFTGENGSNSFSNLTEFDGVFYGTTFLGGNSSQGVIYKINPNGSSFSVIHNFNGTEGSSPWANLIQSGGILYGTTYEGGLNNYGTIFKIYPDGSSFSSIHSFDLTNGRSSYSNLVEFAGNFYGNTSFGGSLSSGVVFSINAISGSFSVIHNFDVDTGAGPRSGLIELDGVLYGTTNGGGLYNNGNIYKIVLSNVEFYINGDTDLESNFYSIELNRWHHAAISRTGFTSSFFLDGIKKIEVADNNNYTKNEISLGTYYTDINGYSLNGITSQPRVIVGEGIYTQSFFPSATFSIVDNTEFLINVLSPIAIYDSSTFSNSIIVTNVGFTSSLPETLVMDGLISYLDATSLTSYNDGSIWYDLSGNNNNANLYNGFTFSQDNSGVLEFDGYGILFNPSVATRGEINLNLSSSDCTIIYGTRFLQNTPGFVPSGRSLGGKNANWLLGTWNNSTSQFFSNPSGFVIGGTGSQSDLNWHIYTGVMGSLTQFWDNDTKLVSVFDPDAIGPNGIVLASDGVFGESSNCQISFLLVYERCLTDSEILQNYNYFKSRFF